jgi:hypothetical protein
MIPTILQTPCSIDEQP